MTTVTVEELTYFQFLEKKLQEAAITYAIAQVASKHKLKREWLIGEWDGNSNETYYIKVRRRKNRVFVETVYADVHQFVLGMDGKSIEERGFQ